MIQIFYQIICTLLYKIHRFVSVVRTKWHLIGNRVVYGNYRIVGSPIIKVGVHGKICLGNDLQMNNGLLDNQIGYSTPCILRAINGAIVLGDNVGMSQTTLVAYNSDIIIGNNVRIGGGVKIYTTDFHSLNYIERRDYDVDAQNMKSSSVYIDDDSFIGAGTVILKGVHIGCRSIIGAGSVVTKDIPADVIAGGNPCVVLKSLG